MLAQIIEKKTSTPTDELDTKYLINADLEKQRFLVDEKKMKLIQLESKINALGAFNS